ncbi:1-deoxy-D-xylulose-5-phosphate reductoisomerase [Alkalicoccus urumqiensis]|uniref:1-deoxy-D-xylulose 5-phosphate reductoisomerase n=1 Tax=Alkalicoccus urumqiensis TaxID=1548213 RepID=A0A2P6MG03_ALKUR|nr:1-deoxy-D-xylulose-5-phosphate reductoisomerase [Alkalicoccus urumqiensis]PRO65197.1 1-deoxy-D-xylulose-5-phosphate reductoisomerase [Alkalicoccus urumqiensis]
MRGIHLLGATGSIGEQTIDIIRHYPESFSLRSAAFGTNTEKAAGWLNELRPEIISVQTEKAAADVSAVIDYKADILIGREGVMACAAAGGEGDILLNAVMGSAGLEPTLKAMETGMDIAIANKETLVAAGHLVMEKQKETGVKLLPVDSEHSALWQCLDGEAGGVEQLILTASGGSFRDKTRDELKGVTVKEALNHPNWSMGAKITIDSATMMNKGLEVIEAHWLFQMPYEKIDVVLHKESIIHSMVEYQDGSILAHLGTPDMKVPIQYALTHPRKLAVPGMQRLKLWEAESLHFQKMNGKRYRAFETAVEAGKMGGTAPCVLNAANEQAVAMFLDGRIDFLTIDNLVEHAVEKHEFHADPALSHVLSLDQETRSRVEGFLK